MQNYYTAQTNCCVLKIYGSRCSRMDQVKFMEDSLQKIWSDMVCLEISDMVLNLVLNKVVFHKFYLVHSWIPWPISRVTSSNSRFATGFNVFTKHFLLNSLNFANLKRFLFKYLSLNNIFHCCLKASIWILWCVFDHALAQIFFIGNSTAVIIFSSQRRDYKII